MNEHQVTNRIRQTYGRRYRHVSVEEMLTKCAAGAPKTITTVPISQKWARIARVYTAWVALVAAGKDGEALARLKSQGIRSQGEFALVRSLVKLAIARDPKTLMTHNGRNLVCDYTAVCLLAATHPAGPVDPSHMTAFIRDNHGIDACMREFKQRSVRSLIRIRTLKAKLIVGRLPCTSTVPAPKGTPKYALLLAVADRRRARLQIKSVVPSDPVLLERALMMVLDDHRSPV